MTDHHPLKSPVPETIPEANSKLEWKIGLGLFIFCLLGILINLLE
jgi:hypothetical protein